MWQNVERYISLFTPASLFAAKSPYNQRIAKNESTINSKQNLDNITGAENLKTGAAGHIRSSTKNVHGKEIGTFAPHYNYLDDQWYSSAIHSTTATSASHLYPSLYSGQNHSNA